jgi:hypothetical protein
VLTSSVSGIYGNFGQAIMPRRDEYRIMNVLEEGAPENVQWAYGRQPQTRLIAPIPA